MAVGVSFHLGGFHKAISDVYYTTQGGLFNPDYNDLLKDLNNLEKKETLLSEAHRDNVLHPFIRYLNRLEKEGFDRLFSADEDGLSSDDRSLKHAIEEISEALLQRDHQFKYFKSSFEDLLAFQAVVETIYRDVLKSTIGGLALNNIAPLAKWGRIKGPITLPVRLEQSSSISKMNLRAGTVTLPSEHRTGGLLAWATLGHEVGGHNILHAYKDLIPELQTAVKTAIASLADVPIEIRQKLADYWHTCTEETASDLLGLLNIGPSFGIALLGYFRGARGGKLNTTGPLHPQRGTKRLLRLYSDDQSFSMLIKNVSQGITLKKEKGVLGKFQDADLNYERFNFEQGKHPVDILRPYVIARGTALIGTSRLAELLRVELENDRPRSGFVIFQELVFSPLNPDTPTTNEFPVAMDIAIRTAEAAAEAILNTRLQCLNNETIQALISWDTKDDIIVEEIKKAISNNLTDLPPLPAKEKFYARHVVSASVLASVETDSDVEKIFIRMKKYLLDASGKIV